MSEEDRIAQLEAQLGAMRAEKQAGQDDTDKRALAYAVKAAAAKVDAAEKALEEAFDDGDGADIAKAQRALTESIAQREKVNMEAQNIASNRGWTRGNNSGGEDLDTTNLDNWKSSHSDWYGVDKDMTKAAHEIDAQIRGAGVLEPGSREYFIAIDKQMAQKYPDRFRGTPPTGGGGGGGAHYPRGGTQRIEKEIAEGYRRMGIDIDDPVVAKRMIQNREVAVQKGLLPAEKPRSLRVKSR